MESIDVQIGERLKKVRLLLGFDKQETFADNLGLKSVTYGRYENGDRGLPDEVKLKLFEMGVNISWLIAGDGTVFHDKEDSFIESTNKEGINKFPIYNEADIPVGAFIVPLLDQKLSAGKGLDLQSDDVSTALVRVPAYLSKYGDKVAALTVDGDSMYPTLHRGDMVVCDSCGWSGEGIYALRMSGSGFVKRLTKAPGKIIILSDNPKYPTREEPEESQDIQIIGRVHCSITKVE